MKVIAMYLPQFHRVVENEKWWGKGFTDWVAARNAKPLYEGHYQPHIPLNDDYYDLLDKKTIEMQADLMHKYDVDGMCIYHYWFKDGKQILEKPAENLLRWTDIDMPFCFCWANETWARSWSNLSQKNAWADIYETEQCGDEILLEQSYGDKVVWKNHFEYLLPFFLDRRYLRVGGKPIFVIYKTDHISVLYEMASYWDELARENGLAGLYLVGVQTDGFTRSVVDAELNIEPGKGMCNLANFMCCSDAGCSMLSYDTVWDAVLSEAPIKEKTYFGAFVSFDDTPRRGNNGLVIRGASPKKFGHYLARLMAKNKAYGSEIVFLNAWNEWGEGMHLEPDQKYEYQYLEKIPYAKEEYFKYVPYYTAQRKEFKATNIQVLFEEKEKHEYYFHLLDKWMTLKEKGACAAQYLLDKGYRSIAIYGFGKLGKHLLNELNNTDIEVQYIIDQREIGSDGNMTFYRPGEYLPKVDAVIITAVYYINEVRKTLSLNGLDAAFISIETVIDECMG